MALIYVYALVVCLTQEILCTLHILTHCKEDNNV
jgi:hypothetical protein